MYRGAARATHTDWRLALHALAPWPPLHSRPRPWKNDTHPPAGPRSHLLADNARAPDTRLGPLDLGLGLLAAAPTSRACWYMSCAGAAVRLTPPPPPKSKASASAAACSNGSSAAAPAGSTGHSGNDSSMATPRGIPADWLAALAVKRGTAALSGAPAAHDAPPLLYGNESQGFCPALRDCQAVGPT